jgi:transposase
MKYTMEERLEIGRRIYQGEISRFEAAAEYGIGGDTARDYMRLYKAENNLPTRQNFRSSGNMNKPIDVPAQLESYESMTKEELIQELVKAKIVEARLKKGYEVRGVGAQKEYVPLDNKNTK